jgi:hypothetical protein
LFGRSCACLRECQRGDQRTSGCDNAFVHIPFPFFGFCLDPMPRHSRSRGARPFNVRPVPARRYSI